MFSMSPVHMHTQTRALQPPLGVSALVFRLQSLKHCLVEWGTMANLGSRSNTQGYQKNKTKGNKKKKNPHQSLPTSLRVLVMNLHFWS